MNPPEKITFLCCTLELFVASRCKSWRVANCVSPSRGTRRFAKLSSCSLFCCGRFLPLMAKCKCVVCTGQTCTLTVHWHLQLFVTRLCCFAYNLNCDCTCAHCLCFCHFKLLRKLTLLRQKV